MLTDSLPLGCPKSSPWGRVQDGTAHGEGMFSVSTASHGGMWVSADTNKKIPAAFRKRGGFYKENRDGSGWYEEDVEFAIPVFFFPDRFDPENVESARRTLRSWRWRAWEEHFCEIVPIAESRQKAEYIWYSQHANELITTSAWGGGHKSVPKGMVGVCARVGGYGRDPVSDDGRFFLVTDEEYATRHNNPSGSIVIDPARHAEWCGPANGATRKEVLL